MPLSDFTREQRRAEAEQEYRANEQAAIGQEQARRRRLSELQANPQVQEGLAMEQYLRSNPGLAQEIMRKRVEEAYSTPKPGPIVQSDTGIYEQTPRGLVRLKEPGTERPLMPKKTAKPITEQQGRNAMFGMRASMADKILNNLEEKENLLPLTSKQGFERTPFIGGIAGTLGNAMLPANLQKIDQAQRNFVNAVLRQESGAVINPDEFDNARKQYFAQPGDSKEVVEQKRQNRKAAIAGFKTIAGDAWKSTEEELKQIQAVSAPSEGVKPYDDPEKEKRYQEWAAKQSK